MNLIIIKKICQNRCNEKRLNWTYNRVSKLRIRNVNRKDLYLIILAYSQYLYPKESVIIDDDESCSKLWTL